MKAGLDRVVLALDTADAEELEASSARFGPRVGVLKVGLEAFVRLGPGAVEVARRHGRRIFLDLKLHDIPNTVAGAVRAAGELGVDYLTVHVGGGRAMLEAAQAAAASSVRLLGVTLLTHLGADDLVELGLENGPERVARWASLAHECGLAGVVCSPREVAALRARFAPPFELVTPGIRWRNGADDQRRVATPEAALDAGADLLVIGRPITAAPDPEAALAELERRLASSAGVDPP